MKEYDIVVVGAGSGGLTAAYTAKGFLKKILLIEKNKVGGECTWSGCIPSKALINIGKEIHICRKYNPNMVVDTAQILKRVHAVIQNVYQGETPEVLDRDGIDFMQGFARFIDSNTLTVNGIQIKAKKIIISTGSSPFVPPIKGLEKVKYFTNENIFNEQQLPKSIIVLGGGAIGVELSQALNRIGVKISLVEMMDSILFREEAEMTKLLEGKLVAEGIDIHTSTKAVEIEEVNNKIYLKVEDINGTKILEGDSILIALGRTPNTKNLDLEKVGINFNKKGIIVNKYLETSVKGIYAIGDVVGPYQFSHMANVQGITALQNAILPINKKMDYANVAWCTFSQPELARAGLTEEESRAKYGDSIRVYTQSYDHLDRSKTKEDSLGLVKVICDKTGLIIGASILGDRAGEIISEIQTMKTLGIKFAKLSKVIHPYPTYSEILVKMSKKAHVHAILNNPFIKIINFFRK